MLKGIAVTMVVMFYMLVFTEIEVFSLQ